MARGQRLERALVADPFDDDDCPCHPSRVTGSYAPASGSEFSVF
jgi:hypothetical protein